MQVERTLIDQFLNSLRALPGVFADAERADPELSGGDRVYDARIELRVAGGPITLFAEVRRDVYPRDVREVLWHFKNPGQWGSSVADREAHPLLVAEFISPGAKELLRAERIAYFDSGGSLFIPARAAYLYVEKPPPKPFQRAIRTIFTGRRSQVLHALLVRDRSWFGVTKIAREAKVVPSTASEVLSQLDRFDWLESRGQGPNKERRLREPRALLDAWAKQQAASRPPSMRQYYVPGFRAEALLDHIGRVFGASHINYAVTGEAAAQRYAPFLTAISVVRTRVLAGPVGDTAAAELGARMVNEGYNLVILETRSIGDLLFREHVGDTWLASPVQVYLDLIRGDGRAKELAEHLRRERIRF